MEKGQFKHTAESLKKAVETRRKNGSYNTSWNKGIPMRKTTKLKLRKGQKEKGIIPPSRKGQISPNTRLENHPNWKGENANYFALHSRVRKYFERPIGCEWCGNLERKLCWANKSGKYLFERDDWISLCYSCHKIQEKGLKEKKFRNGKLIQTTCPVKDV